MNDLSTTNLGVQQKETLISMIALLYIEERTLLNEEQLKDAQASLRALFLHATGEETMLHKLIRILKANQAVNRTFRDMSHILSGIAKGARTIETKIEALKQQISKLEISAEEHADFIGPFFAFSHEFHQKVDSFRKLMQAYQEAREKEARYTNMFRIAREARARLKTRFASGLASETKDEVEHQIKEKVIQSFDYGETELNHSYSKQEARSTEQQILVLLGDFKEMCQMAMNPDMREEGDGFQPFHESPFDDVFSLFAAALQKHPHLETIKAVVLELFRLYQHSYGMFNLDFQKFNEAIKPILKNTEAYFQAKEENDDIRVKQEKLNKIEGLIGFLERTTTLLSTDEVPNYTKFSKKISGIITDSTGCWEHISEDLLRLKVTAEAELSTRLT